MGRPKKNINEEQVFQLASINCSHAEMGAVLGCSSDTLERRFAAVIKRGRGEGKMSLKRAMWTKAIKDKNTTMQIWLSKQMLGYADKVVETSQIELELKAKKSEEQMSGLTMEQLLKLYRAELK